MRGWAGFDLLRTARPVRSATRRRFRAASPARRAISRPRRASRCLAVALFASSCRLLRLPPALLFASLWLCVLAVCAACAVRCSLLLRETCLEACACLLRRSGCAVSCQCLTHLMLRATHSTARCARGASTPRPTLPPPAARPPPVTEPFHFAWPSCSSPAWSGLRALESFGLRPACRELLCAAWHSDCNGSNLPLTPARASIPCHR